MLSYQLTTMLIHTKATQFKEFLERLPQSEPNTLANN